MKLLLDANNAVIGYEYIGGSDGVEIDEKKLPTDFYDHVLNKYYVLDENNDVKINPNYQEPTPLELAPTETQQQLAQVTYQQMMATQDVTALQTQNAQMAYQLMMLGGTK